MGIYKRKQEMQKTRKHALDQESDQEKKKKRTQSRKKERKHALDQESDQEKKKNLFFLYRFLGRGRVFFLFFFFTFLFSFMNSHPSSFEDSTMHQNEEIHIHRITLFLYSLRLQRFQAKIL